MGDRDVPFMPTATCDACGAHGAFDFMGDLFCDACARIGEPEPEWRCVIPGKPRQKGNSKRAFVAGGRAIVTADKRTTEAQANAKGIVFAQRPAELMRGALVVDVDFVFAIPKTRQKGKGALSPGDPHVQRPDRGNLLKMVEDVLEGIVYGDDCVICDGRVRKLWGERDETRVVVKRADVGGGG